MVFSSYSVIWLELVGRPSKFFVGLAMIATVFMSGCQPDDDDVGQVVEWDTTPFVLSFPQHIVAPQLPLDNPLTITKVELGRMLFHEPKLSGDGSMSCSTCHLQSAAFTDTAKFSVGIRGLEGHRNAMSVFNMAWNDNGFFGMVGPNCCVTKAYCLFKTALKWTRHSPEQRRSFRRT